MEQNSPGFKEVSSKPSNSGLVVLVVFLVAIFTSTIYLFLQNRQLSRQISLLRSTPAITPTPTLTITPTPTVDETAEWKTYTNTKYGYEFKYPSTFNIEVNETRVGKNSDKYLQTVWLTNPSNSKPNEVPVFIANFTPMIYYLPANSAKDIFLNYKKETNIENINNIMSEGTINVGNYSGHQVISKTKAPKPSLEKQYLISRKIYLFEKKLPISIEFGEWITEEQYQQKKYWPVNGLINDQILSTFKFSDQPSESKYKCPENGWVNCMPSVGTNNTDECSSEAMSWYKQNCSNFQGGAM